MAPRKAAALRAREDGATLRAHLITTAAGLIASTGSAGLTVRAIAREAGVADGVLYNHFTDKEELLANALHLHVHTVEQGLGVLPEPGTGTVEANLRAHLVHGLALHRAIVPAFAGLLGQPGVLSRFAQLSGSADLWRDRLARYLHAERDLGRLRPEAEVDAAVALIVGLCHETVLSDLLPAPIPGAAPPPAESVVAALLDGIGP